MYVIVSYAGHSENDPTILQNFFFSGSCFLTSNDLTHSLSSYLKEMCPKRAEVQTQHTENSSVILFIVCNSTLRLIKRNNSHLLLLKQLTTFEREAKVLKLFVKHINVEEQLKLEVTYIGEGTPGRLKALLGKGKGLSLVLALPALCFLLLDWNWRDQKLRMMVDIPDVQTDLLKLLDTDILKGCREGKVQLGLF
ncbi:protein CMSS1-like [Oncorhynchus clarkii lewisi]|uniref:protein CMSS1-like n=1 Tax=Oncorhynchus clarkii lewisi TaxID=490388 RepID=UPI0039B89708